MKEYNNTKKNNNKKEKRKKIKTTKGSPTREKRSNSPLQNLTY